MHCKVSADMDGNRNMPSGQLRAAVGGLVAPFASAMDGGAVAPLSWSLP